MRRLLLNLLLVLASSALALGIAEGALRLFAPQPRQGLTAVQDPVTGLPVSPSQGSAIHEFGGRRVWYHFSAPHLRGPGPRPGTFRVLIVGDSFTFGELLPEAATFVSRIERDLRRVPELSRVQLLNGGGRGYGTAEYVRFVERFGPGLQPAAVVVFLNSDDIGRVAANRLYRTAGDSLIAVRAPVARAKQWANGLPGYDWVIGHSHLAALLRSRLLLLLRGARTAPSEATVREGPSRTLAPEAAEAAVRTAERLFERLASWCRTRGIPLMVVTTGWADPGRYGTPEEPTLRFLAQAPPFFAALGVPYHDLNPTLYPHRRLDPARYSIPGDGHPSEAGAALIARGATPVLRDWLRSIISPSVPPSPAQP